MSELYRHLWDHVGPGDYPRWTRMRCRKCGAYGQFHKSGTIRDQDKQSCTVNKLPPSPASIAKHKKSQEERNAN